MTDLICVLIELLKEMLGLRPRGRHRADRIRMAASFPPCPPRAPAGQQNGPEVPSPRSPYGLHELLSGDETIMVRPYLAAHEKRERQRERRVTLLALDGIDIDPDVIHGVRVGVGVA